jgi:hypothetical protein
VNTADIVRRAAEQIRRRYVLPEPGAALADALLAALEAGRFDGLDAPALCPAATAVLHEVHSDRHLSLSWHERAQPEFADNRWAEPDFLAAHLSQLRQDNHGVYRVERLPGNVGYLDLRSILHAEVTAPTLAAAMAVLQHTGALLLDLRHNSGGAPSGVAFLCSYFFDAEPVHLNDVYSRATDGTQQYWTLPHLPGPRYLDRAVFVLTSAATFSGAEEIAYNLQQQRRATIVGEVTRGGAHPVGEFWLDPHVTIRLPISRSINPVSGTNWEGIGVQPDVAVRAGDAFDEAYALSLRAVLAGLGDPPAPSEHDLHAEASDALAKLDGTERPAA